MEKFKAKLTVVNNGKFKLKNTKELMSLAKELKLKYN